MSFKRVADDFDDFNLQRKRRVNDLLLDEMPSDEVTLMANGKLACTVCRHCPVFDTTAMLSIHRNGKKHLANALVKLEREKEDAEIRQKREHESYLKTISESGEAPLLGITKFKIELALSRSMHSTKDSGKSPRTDNDMGATNSKSLRTASGTDPTSRPFFTPATKIHMSGSLQPRNDSGKSVRTDYGMGPTNSKSLQVGSGMGPTNQPFFTATKINTSSSSQTRNNSTEPLAKSTRPANIHFFTATKIIPADSKQRPQHNSNVSSSSRTPCSAIKSKESRKDRFLSVNPLTKQKYTLQETCQEVEANNAECLPSTSQSHEGTPNIDNVEVSAYDQLDSRSRVLYLSKLRQMGWIMGLDGKWKKDENAEFDSDEDEPPSPKSLLRE